jgi:hypothetical protein
LNPSLLPEPADRLLLGLARPEGERVAIRNQALGDREPDARVCAGDERDAIGVGQLAHLPTLPRRDRGQLGLVE